YQPQYFEKVKVSRGLRKVGEVFAMKLKGVGCLFGRVIRNDCACGPTIGPRPWKRTLGYYLVYVYRPISMRIDDIPELSRSDLLIPPAIIEGRGWTLGYFVPVRYDKLAESDVRPAHCFWREDHLDENRRKWYMDEYGNPLRQRIEPCDVM